MATKNKYEDMSVLDALENGQIPLAPHLMFPQFMKDADKEERELAFCMDIVLMGKCDEVWVLDERISCGMQMVIDKATKAYMKFRNKKVK